MIQGFMLGTIFGMFLELACIVLTMARAKRKERIEQYETGKRESNNSTGLHWYVREKDMYVIDGGKVVGFVEKEKEN